MKRNPLALLLALLLALTLPLTALGEDAEGGEPTYINPEELDSFDSVTRVVLQLGESPAPEEFVLSAEVDGVTMSMWIQQEGEDVTVFFCSEAPFNPFGRNMDEAFAIFPNVREVCFNGAFDASDLSSMERMFQGCSKLERIDFTGFYSSGSEDMRGMFSGCASLTSLDLRTLHFRGSRDIEGIFEGCTNLAEVLVNESTSREAVARLEAEMGDCATHTVTVERPESKPGPAADPSAVYATPEEVANGIKGEIVGVYFLPSTQGAPEGHEIALDVWEMFVPEQTGTSWVEKRDEGYAVYFASDECFRADTALLFRDFTSMREVDFNGCFDGSNLPVMNAMFQRCASLTTVDLSSISAEWVADMNSMFWGCENLETVDLSGLYIDPKNWFGSTFRDCPNLKEIIVNRGTSPEVIEGLKGAMADCAGQTVTVK